MRSIPHRLTRSAGLAGIISRPQFLLPMADAGAGVVNTTPTTGGAATFTRATTAWTKLSTGLWGSVASGSARSCYLGATTAVGAYAGYLSEIAATNQCLQARDLSNASWVKTTATAVKDQAGIDGVASSASSLTATLGGGSCLQTITEAATTSAFSLFIKRITGTGTVVIQQGASTLDVTASINSSTYTRVEIDASVLNPIVGIVLGTNGDKIAVDMCQFENGSFATSPVPTTTASVTRDKDQLTYVGPNNATTPLTVYVEASQFLASAGWAIGINDATANNESELDFSTSQIEARVVTGGVTQAQPVNIAYSLSVIYKVAGVFNLNYVNSFVNGAPSTLDTVATMPTTNFITVAMRANAANQLNGCVKNIKIWYRILTNVQIAGL